MLCGVISSTEPGGPDFVSSRCEVRGVDQFLDATSTLGGAAGYGAFFRELPTGAVPSSDEERLRQIAVDEVASDK